MIEDYLREVHASLRVDAPRKRQIVDELRTHLTEKVEEIQNEEPQRARADIEQEVLREFGNPRDLALSYDPEGSAVLLNSAGDIVLLLGKAVGRGAAVVGRSTGRVLKWTAVTLAALLVVSLGVGAWAYYEVKPYIPAIIEQSGPAYQYGEQCAATACNGDIPADTFFVREEAKTIRFDLSIYPTYRGDHTDPQMGSGTVRVTVNDPAGAPRFDRTFSVSNASYYSQETSWGAMEGNWSVAYSFTDFVGIIDVETRVISFPMPE